jgi:hypothetical protein
MDMVHREVPFGEAEKSGKRVLYRITDPLMATWFKTVAPHRALLAQATAAGRRRVWEQVRTGLFASTWEGLVREAIPFIDSRRMSKALSAPFMPAARYWRGSGPEWDVVSLSADRETLLLGEVKWSENPIGPKALAEAAAQLRRKGTPPLAPAPAKLVHCLFVPRTSGHVREVDGMTVIDAAEVLAALR